MRALFLTLCLAACATPYGGDNPVQRAMTGTTLGGGAGVSAASLGAGRWRISGQVNSFTGRDRLQDYLLLKAAETAQANGAAGFVILEQADATGSSANGAAYPGGILVVQLLSTPDGGAAYFDAAETIAAIGPRVRR